MQFGRKRSNPRVDCWMPDYFEDVAYETTQKIECDDGAGIGVPCFGDCLQLCVVDHIPGAEGVQH